MAFATLPALIVSWTQVVPAGGDTFVRYSVFRRPTGTSTFTRIASIPSLTTTSYTDYTPQSGQSYDYTMSYTVTRGGAQVESTQATPVAQSVTFVSAFLQDVASPASNYVEFVATGETASQAQDQTPLQVWGRSAPTMHVGEGHPNGISVTGGMVHNTDRSVWNGVQNLLLRQQTNGSVLLWRGGVPQERLFVQIEGQSLQRIDGTMTYAVAMKLLETTYDEAVA